jgi:hypothetical protein
MNVRLLSCQSECSLWLNTLRAYGSPLPGQGEGEGFSEGTHVADETSHLNPLPFSEGRREKGHVGLSAKLNGHNVGDDFDLVRLAITKCWHQ